MENTFQINIPHDIYQLWVYIFSWKTFRSHLKIDKLMNNDHFYFKSLQNLKQTVSEESEHATKEAYDSSSKGSYGYGGKFGVQTDRMDKVGFSHFSPEYATQRFSLSPNSFRMHLVMTISAPQRSMRPRRTILQVLVANLVFRKSVLTK